MDRLTRALRMWPERPKVGAGAVFLSLQTKKGVSKWAERIFSNASWLLIVSVGLITLLSLRNEASLQINHIGVLLGLYTLYVLILEATSRTLRDNYDTVLFRIGRIAVNTATVSALVWFCSGVGSYFWFFYSLPVLQALIYFGTIAALVVGAGVVIAYWTVSIIATNLLGQTPDYALLAMNSLVLSIVSVVLYWLFRAARESRKVEHFEALLAVQRIPLVLDTATGLDDMLEKIIKAVVRAVEASSGSLMLLDKQTDALKIRVRYPLIRPWWKEDREFKLGEGIAGWVAQHKEPYLCLDAARDPRFVKADPEGSIKSLLAVPIVSHGRSLGVISVDSMETGVFDENDMQLLLAFASYVGDRIEKAKLLDALYGLGQSTSLDLPEALQIILEQLETVVGYDSAAIFLIEEGRAKVVAARGFPDVQKARKVSFASAEDALFQEMSRTKRPLVITDVRKDKRFRALGGTEYVQSWLEAPLVTEGKVIGLLTLDSRNVGHFNQVDAEFVSVFARHAALAIEGARFHEHQRRWSQELEALQQTALDITAQLDRDYLQQTIIQRAVELLEAKGGGIYEYDPAQGELTVMADWGGKRSIVGHKLKVGDGMAGRVVQTGEPLIVDDYCTWRGRAPIYEPDLFRAVVEVPLECENRILGVLYVTDDAKGRVFAQRDAYLLSLLASQASIAIENSRLLEEIQQQASELQLLLAISATVASGRSLHESLQRLAETVVRLLPTTFVYVALLEQDSKALRIEAAHPIRDGLQWEPGVGQSYPLSASRGDARAVETAEPQVLCTDVPDEDKEVLAEIERRLQLSEKLQSVCLIPLRSVNGHPFGVLCLGEVRRPERIFFSPQRVGLCEAMADQTAVIIERAWLLDKAERRLQEVQRKAQELKLVNQIATIVNSTLDLDQILQTAVTEMAKVFDVRQSGVVIFDQEAGYGQVRAEYQEVKDSTAEKVKIPLKGNPSMEWILTHKRPLAIEDAPSDSLLASVRDVVELRGIKSILVVPLLVKGEVFGTIGLDALDVPRVFTEEEIELAQTIANQVALAIENAELFEQTRRRAMALATLHDTSLDLTRYQRVPELVKSILERAVELLQAKGGGLYMLDESSEQVKLAAVSNLPEELVGMTLQVGDSVVGHVIETKAHLSVSNYRNWPHRLRQYDEYGFTAVAGTPIAWQDKIWGAIAVHDDVEGRTFGQEDLDLLSHLGNLAAVALENARRTDELERLMTSVIDAIIVVDEQGRVVEFNEQAEKVLGYGAEEVLGQSVGPLYYDPEEARRVRRLLLESEDGRITDIDTSVTSKDGERIPIRLSASLLFDYEGKRAGSAGFFRDLREIESAKRQIRQLSGLLATAQAITSQLDLLSVLDSIATNALEALDDVDAIALYPYDPDKDEFQVPPVLKGITQPEFILGPFNPNSVVARLMEIGEAHFADNAAADRVMAGDFVARESIASSAGVPLKVGAKIVGVMFFNYREAHPFTDEEKNVISILANQAAIAIKNAQLYEETQRHLEELTLLHEVMMAAFSAIELDKVLQATADTIAESLGYESVGIRLMGNTGQLTGPAYYAGFQPQSLNISRDRGITGRVVREGKPALVPDVSEDADYVASHPATKSEMSVPLCIDERVIGAMNVESTTLNAFTEHDLRLMETIAGQVVNRIENARLYTQLRKTQERLAARTAVAWLGMVSSTWAHKIRGNAQTIRDYIELLRPVVATTAVGGEVLEKLDLMGVEAKKIQDIPLTAPLSAEEGVEVIDLNAMLRERALRLLEPYGGSITLELKLDSVNSAKVRANRLWLMRALDILIDNATDAMSESEVRTLTISTDAAGKFVKAHVTDTGRGVPPAVQPLLLKELVPKEDEEKGSGMGLLLASTIIQTYGGEIVLGPTGPGGTTIIVSLPRNHDLSMTR